MKVRLPCLPTAGGAVTGGLVASELGVANIVNNTGKGLSLYGGAKAGLPNHGIAFSGIATFGGHGAVTGDWATYLVNEGASNRGWIFKTSPSGTGGNVASISNGGVVTAARFDGPLNGNAATATALRTARTINGVPFNGSANITIADATKLPLAGGTVTGVTAFSNTTASTSATTGALRTSGGLGVAGAIFAGGNVTAYSDARLKTDLAPIEGALVKVQKLTGYTYTRIDTGERDTGLIAQDVQRVLPEAVKGGDVLSLAYGNLAGLLVEAIKELSERVSVLEAR